MLVYFLSEVKKRKISPMALASGGSHEVNASRAWVGDGARRHRHPILLVSDWVIIFELAMICSGQLR